MRRRKEVTLRRTGERPASFLAPLKCTRYFRERDLVDWAARYGPKSLCFESRPARRPFSRDVVDGVLLARPKDEPIRGINAGRVVVSPRDPVGRGGFW